MASESLGPAVADGKLLYTSPSAINRFVGCPRSWYYRYVERRPDKPGPEAELGTAGHERIEQYLKTGADVLTPHERIGLPYMPPPGVASVEQPFELWADGVPIRGKMDCVLGPVVTDWKFKTKLWSVKTKPKELVNPLSDIGRQMLAYAYATASQSGERIFVRHVYFQLPIDPKTGQTFEAAALSPVETTIQGAELEARWNAAWGPHLDGMKEVAKAATAADVRGKRNYCWKFGRRCPYMSICPAHQDVELFTNSDTGVKSMGLFDPPEAPAEILPPDVPPAPPLEIKTAESESSPKKRKVVAKCEVIPVSSLMLGTFLYFGAYPIGVPISTLHGYVEVLEKAVLSKFGEKVPDIRLAAHDSLKFGKWKAVLGAMTKQIPPPPGYFVIGTEEKETVVADALKAVAAPGTVVIGGTR